RRRSASTPRCCSPRSRRRSRRSRSMSPPGFGATRSATRTRCPSTWSRRPASGRREDHRMDMRGEAERYCTLIGTAEQGDRMTFTWAVAESLAGLTATASRLAPVDMPGVALPDRPTDEAWVERFTAVQNALGDWAAYRTTLDPYDESAEIESIALGDDLA